MQICIIPGLFCSTIRFTGDLFPTWASSQTHIAVNQVLAATENLRCNEDGTSQAPVVCDGLLNNMDPLIAGLSANNTCGLNIITKPHDWRMRPSVIVDSTFLSGLDQPTVYITYSNGVNVATEVWRQLVANGQSDNFVGLFVIAGPMSLSAGNWSAVQGLDGRGNFFALLLGLSQLGQLLFGIPYLVSALSAGGNVNARKSLLSLVASWDSMSVLLPEIPALMQKDWWDTNTSNPYIRSEWLARGEAERLQLFNNLPPPERVYQFYGQSYNTPSSLTENKYYGDATVATVETMYPESFTFWVDGVDHQGILSDEQVHQTIMALICNPQGFNPSEISDRVWDTYNVGNKTLRRKPRYQAPAPAFRLPDP